MPIINITVKGKVASSDTKVIVNGNSDYVVNWVLDGEWADYDTKTMRVRFFDGSVINSIFSGTSCSLPVITETCMIEIGLFAGDLITSTPAVINCIRCIRDDEGPVQDPTPSIYDQLLAKLNELGSGSAMRVEGGYIQYSTDNGKTWVNLIAESDLKGDKGDKGADGVNGVDGKDGAPGKDGTNGKDGTDGITPHIGENGNWYIGSTDTGKPSRGAAGSAGQAGKDGKSAYQYAQEGGYTGTETEFAKKLASEAMIVTITDNNGTLSADKSYIEIRDAILAGISVLVDYNGVNLPFIEIDDALYFGTFYCDDGVVDLMVSTTMIEILPNGEVNDISSYVEALPNPYALTFTGAVTGSYNGSAPMSVNIPSAVTDDHINSLIDTKLGVIENGSY